MRNKIISIIMIVIMGLAIVGCGKEEKDTKEGNDQQTQEEKPEVKDNKKLTEEEKMEVLKKLEDGLRDIVVNLENVQLEVSANANVNKNFIKLENKDEVSNFEYKGVKYSSVSVEKVNDNLKVMVNIKLEEEPFKNNTGNVDLKNNMIFDIYKIIYPDRDFSQFNDKVNKDLSEAVQKQTTISYLNYSDSVDNVTDNIGFMAIGKAGDPIEFTITLSIR